MMPFCMYCFWLFLYCTDCDTVVDWWVIVTYVVSQNDDDYMY